MSTRAIRRALIIVRERLRMPVSAHEQPRDLAIARDMSQALVRAGEVSQAPVSACERS